MHGTVNDLRCAVPGRRGCRRPSSSRWGFLVEELRDVVADMARAAAQADIAIITGDMKVVDKGA